MIKETVTNFTKNKGHVNVNNSYPFGKHKMLMLEIILKSITKCL